MPNSLHLHAFSKLFLLSCVRSLAHAAYTPFLTQSFFFSYEDPAHPAPHTITSTPCLLTAIQLPFQGSYAAQCETLHVTWERGSATGPNPTAPYFLQIYTSTFVFPFVVAAGSGRSFDWRVPFAPGTQYQICMFDKNGNTGGCQATYTVISSTDTVPPICQNVTFPLGTLDVDAVVASGPLSQYGWVDQCTDLSVSSKNGTPPYTLTIAPALHPPYNITTDNTRMNWTVSLSWASLFFISIVDAEGNSWANGPLHSGSGRTACLSLGDVSSMAWVGPSIAVGAGVGGLFIGSLLGIATAYLFMKYRQRKERSGSFMHLELSSPLPTSPAVDSPFLSYKPSGVLSGHRQDSSLASNNHISADSSGLLLNDHYNRVSRFYIEPFVMPSEDGRFQTASWKGRPTTSEGPLSPRYTHVAASETSTSQVYGIHDGKEPVSTYHPDGTQVAELPLR